MSTREKQTLTILHTNDIHSHFGSMSTIAAMINEERDQGGNFLVLDIGDTWTVWPLKQKEHWGRQRSMH